MIIGLLGQLFEPVRMEIFLEMFGPISGLKWTDLGSKMDILGPICPKKWKISGKHNKKIDDNISPRPTLKARLDGNNFGIVWTYFRAQIDQFRVQN